MKGEPQCCFKKVHRAAKDPRHSIHLLQGGCEHSGAELLNTALAAASADWKNK